MSKEEWGTKRTCTGCETRFYDMKKKPPVCPKCATVLELATLAKGRRVRAPIEAKKIIPKPTPEDDLKDIDSKDENNNSPIEDTNDLGGDDSVMKNAIEISAQDKED